VSKVVGFTGNITYDTGKPDGTPQKLLDVTRINKLCWKAKTSLDDGIAQTYQWYLDHIAK
jgi:nucleoside-diphosphate-sugar epimerase